MIGSPFRKKGDRVRGTRRSLASPAIAALAIALNLSLPAKADEAMIEGCLKAAAEFMMCPPVFSCS